MTAQEKPKLAQTLKILTNPDYNHDDPEANDVGFWNPVAASNDLIKISNAVLEVVEAVGEATKRRVDAQRFLREAKQAQEAVEHDMLNLKPMSTNEAKTSKTIEAVILKRLQETNRLEEWEKHKETISQQTAIIERETSVIETGHMWLKVADRMSQNIQSALAFYREEVRRAGIGT